VLWCSFRNKRIFYININSLRAGLCPIKDYMIYAQHFTQEEFRDWAEDMSPCLITMLDVLRFRLGSVIEISGSDYALGWA